MTRSRRGLALAMSLAVSAEPEFGRQRPAEEVSKPDADVRERVNRPVVLRLPGMDRVRVRKDLVYEKDGVVELRMDVYSPPAVGAIRPPVVLFIHGGVSPDLQLRPKEWGIYRSWGRLIAASGMAAAIFNHRVGFPDPNLEEGARDLTAAIAFLRARALELEVDSDRLALAAFSAGGPLLAAPIREPQRYVRCLVAFYCFLDLRGSALHRRFLSEEQIVKFSPAAQIDTARKRIPPIFVARAGRDGIPDLLPGLDRFVAEAIARNVSLDFSNHPEGVHGFDNQNDDERSREIVAQAIAFLKFYLQRD